MSTLNKEARMTPEDIAVLKAMFEDREGAVEAIRKIFYPELTAGDPIHLNKDMWSMLDLDGLSVEQKVIAVEAHQKLVRHIEGCLAVVRTLIGAKDETPEQVLARLQKNSAK